MLCRLCQISVVEGLNTLSEIVLYMYMHSHESPAGTPHLLQFIKARLPLSGKKVLKMKFQVREKSANFIFSQGNLEKKIEK